MTVGTSCCSLSLSAMRGHLINETKVKANSGNWKASYANGKNGKYMKSAKVVFG